MRFIAAISFLSVLLFNLGGYRLLLQHWQQDHDRLQNARLDDGRYEEEELVSVKVPISLPYYTNSAEFERFQGEMEINGQVYKYVKKRIYNDSLEILCIPDANRTRIENARDAFFRLAYDLTTTSQQQKKQPVHTNIKPFSFDYFETFTAYQMSGLAPVLPDLDNRNSALSGLGHRLRVEHPPQSI